MKQAVASAIESISEFLNVQDGKGKKGKKAKGDDEESQPKPKARKKETEEDATMVDQAESDEEESEFEGFESDVDEPGPAVGEPDSEAEAVEEAEFSKFDELLGSSDDDDDEEVNEELYSRFKGQEKVNLDDISVSGSGSESDVEEDLSESSGSASPPPAKKVKESKTKTKKTTKIGLVRDSTFLPTLMGGYISGSESASDIDVAPPKKRLGQRSRQAIWEKKFGVRAKHLRKEKQNGGRDAGWDMKRGAVEAGDQGHRGPWKKGITNPMAHSRSNQGPQQQDTARKEPKPSKRDDEGVLHPSWQAAKKAKEQKSTQFSGQKIVFD